MADSTLVRPGGTYGVQDFRQAVYERKPVQALFKNSKYHHFFPQSGSVKGAQGGDFMIRGSPRILDFSDCFVYMKIRIFDAKTGGNLPQNALVG
jgi:hypothetical protein